MPLTLQQSRVLARHAESGIGPEDLRFAGRVNEAAMRIHSDGDYIGTIARYGVTVVNGFFDIPEDLESVRRVSEISDNTPHSSEGVLLFDDAQAYVFNSASIVAVQQVSQRRFKVLGNKPLAVEVLGKKKFKEAVKETDLLAIDDLYALKLMIIAAFREENNDVEQAGALQSQALTHMSNKTQTAIAAARSIQYGNIAINERSDTVGWARAKLALALTKGVHMDDLLLIDLLNTAESRLLTLTRPWVSGLFKVKSGILSLPQDMEALLKVSVDNCPRDIQAQWFEYDDNGVGYREQGGSGMNVVYRGEYPVLADISKESILSVINFENENDILVSISGINEAGFPVSEDIRIDGALKKIATKNKYSEIKSITKDISKGSISVIDENDFEIAFLKPNETKSLYSRYLMPCPEKEKIVRVIARPRHIPKHNDKDVLQVKNIDALIQMAQGILVEREAISSPEPAQAMGLAKSFTASGVSICDQEMLGRQVGHKKRISTSRHFSLGSIPRIR
jgi:hypothetical protein